MNPRIKRRFWKKQKLKETQEESNVNIKDLKVVKTTEIVVATQQKVKKEQEFN